MDVLWHIYIYILSYHVSIYIFFLGQDEGCFKIKEVIKKRIPVISWLPKYNIGLLLQDVLAGFTVGMTEIPQGIAYAVVAGSNVKLNWKFS